MHLPYLDGMAELDSAADWLGQHGHHTRKLRIAASAWEGGAFANEALAYGLEACGELEELEVEVSPLATHWLGAMASVRCLGLFGELGPLHISRGMGTLSALQSLELSGASIAFQPGARLPPPITRLAVGLSNSPKVLEQASVGMLVGGGSWDAVGAGGMGRCSSSLECGARGG